MKLPEPLDSIKKDDAVKFEVIVEAVPKAAISWSINGKELTTKDGVQIEKDVNNNRYCLNIPKANPGVHMGVIIVKATNAIGSVEHEIKLNILGKQKSNLITGLFQ